MQTKERNFLLFDMNIDDDTLNEWMNWRRWGWRRGCGPERITTFGSEDNLQSLANSNIWFLGGTFKTCPQLSY